MSTRSGAGRTAAPSATKPRLPSTVRLRAVLDSIERHIAQQKVEHAYVLNQDGHEVLSRRGTKRQVMFPQSEIALMRGTILTHNHPMDVSFSPADVRLASNTNMAEMRVVTATHRYSMRPPENGWRPFDALVLPRYTGTLLTEKIVLRAAVRRGEMTVDQANTEILHRVWTHLDTLGLVRYQRTPWNPAES